ncbi:hypothetical protein [Flavobacterium sp.]|jgi:hypothetical protein|uniref:hypothetical protein n=1 Tax=Flavobacterium sp. TaxID=239 RepID=UPI0037C191C6
MKNFKFSIFFGLLISSLLLSCSSEDDNYKSFEGPQSALLFNKDVVLFDYKATSPKFIEVLVSSTTKSDVARTVPVVINSAFTNALPATYSIDMSTAVIPAGQTTAKLRINSGDFSLLPATGSTNLVLEFAPGYTVLSNRTSTTIKLQRDNCPGITRTVQLNIIFDPYASEISWTLFDGSNNVVASSVPYLDGRGPFAANFCLTPGNYKFVMNDSYGDGLAPSGSYNISYTDGTSLATANGNFGFTSTKTFTVSN